MPPLTAEPECGEGRAVALEVAVTQVAQEPATFAYQLQQAAAGGVVFTVIAKMLGQLLDASGEQCNLYLRASGITSGVMVISTKLTDDRGYFLGVESQCSLFLLYS